jgi:hypothetical protein
MKPWSKAKRDRHLAWAKFLDAWAARIRARVKQRTPKRRMNRISEAGDGAPVGATAAKSDDLHDGLRKLAASGPDVTSSQGAIS